MQSPENRSDCDFCSKMHISIPFIFNDTRLAFNSLNYIRIKMTTMTVLEMGLARLKWELYVNAFLLIYGY